MHVYMHAYLHVYMLMCVPASVCLCVCMPVGAGTHKVQNTMVPIEMDVQTF